MSTYYTFRCPACGEQGGFFSRWLTLFAAAAAALLFALPGHAQHAWPTPPAYWQHQAACIERAESGSTNATSNPVSRGYWQITYPTWRSVGGTGDPVYASFAEQRWRAYLIWRRDGGSWREWTTAGGCGLG